MVPLAPVLRGIEQPGGRLAQRHTKRGGASISQYRPVKGRRRASYGKGTSTKAILLAIQWTIPLQTLST